MLDKHIINKVIIDVKNRLVTIEGNGKAIPTQSYKFEEPDEWFGIYDIDNEEVLNGNVWWDEQWGFQFASLEQVGEDNHWQSASDYTNPDELIFARGDDSPFYSEEFIKNTEHHKKNEIKKHVKNMFKQSENALDKKLGTLFLSGAIDIESWDENSNPLLLPKAILYAFLDLEKEQFMPGGRLGKEVKKEAQNIKYYL